MLELMYVRCTQCGYDNSPEYRFCGMCGGALPHPPKEIPQPERDVVLPPVAAPVPPPTPIRVSPLSSGGDQNEKVHGPSFLGLSDDDAREPLDYLDDDEPKRSRSGLITIVILLVAAGGFLGWQWRHDGFPFNRITASSAPAQSSGTAAAPDTSQSQQPSAAANPTSGATEAPAAAPEPASPTANDSSGKPAEAPAQESAATSTSPAETAQSDHPTSAPPTPAAALPAAKVPVRSRARKLQPEKTRAKSSVVETAALTTSPDADLEVAGERYLYGTGLPQNCTRAESSLRTAAMHGNSKAETVLGTMYATGHCVGRDLPAAYRWFARALHQDPQNSRISADLQVLWRQMTPQEKQLATSVAH